MAFFAQRAPIFLTRSPQEVIVDFLRRNATLILCVGLFVTFWMLVYTFAVFKPSYAAKSIVIIKDSAVTGRYVEPDQYYAMQTTTSSSSNPVLNTMGILKTGAISDALYAYFKSRHPDELKKNKIVTRQDWEAFFQDGSSFIKAKNQAGTDLISVQFSWTNPVIAKEALAVVLSAFQDASRDLNKAEQSTRTRFLARQTVEIENQLAAIRKQKSAFQSNKRTVSVQRERDDLAGSRMEIENRLNQIQGQAQGKEDLVRRYQKMLGLSPEKALRASALGQNQSLLKLQDELYRLEQVLSLMNSSLTESNPKVREVQAQIERVKANIEAEKTRTASGDSSDKQPVVADMARNDLIKSMLSAYGDAQDLRSQEALTRSRLAEINSDISGFPKTAEDLANIEEKETALSTALEHLRQKVLEGRIKEDQTLSNVFIVDAPHLPEKAQFPNRSHLIILSLFMGLGVGLATALGKEQLTGNRPYGLPEWMAPIEGEAEAPPFPPVAEEAKNTPIADRPAGTGSTLQPPRVNVMTTEPASDKVSLPATGSLFDSLVPVAGPMLRQQPGDSQFRRDLTEPLKVTPKPERRVENSYPKASAGLPTVLSDADLLPPDDVVAPSRTVKIAPPPNVSLLAESESGRAYSPASINRDLKGVPVMYAAPSQSVMPAAAAPAVMPIEPVFAEAASPVEIAPETSRMTEVATTLYEQQARKMPLPRKLRGVPSFLLEGQTDAPNEAHSQPYTLIPRKQLLSANEEMTTEVASQEADEQAQPETDAVNFPDMNEMAAPDFRPHKPMILPLWLGKSPARNPEAYFGLGKRTNARTKTRELPTSLDRLMADIQNQPARFDV